ncbi:WxL domain-containing protein [Enterococcus faecalis]|uniref:WxL domain-containing protein n=1 Tax=Enterococcus faecalis TaxID=1351 RepID=UPI000DE9FA0B|nr:WxL domain-containing protein [Enterococcus faecalis]EGO8275208.1 WxL domain-containing protein [Enterococcus faecalis]EGO9002609.1 WxL domain-containing protein [Enterococcus faecalis]MDB1624249.1 WxL domain-containing protein [Enterococcus faecalis]NSW11886.1 WxL domain-containing protein [Enterococcus faecalis]TQB26275.1 WxL domain-containing protein [Enterococcus faecalis]
MKKKILASLLVGSAVVGASLAPLSAQATTTGTTPVTVGFEGGTLPDGNGDPNTVDPDPTKPNSNFDLLFIPREYDFGKLSISDDLTKPIPNKRDEGLNGGTEAVGVGDLRGTKEGWHLTAQSTEMKSGNESLQGRITTNLGRYLLQYDETNNTYVSISSGVVAEETKPQIPTPINWSLPLGGEAVLIANASKGQGQGLWRFTMLTPSLNITTPYQQIKTGNYTGTITWNLVAGPSTPAPSN